MIPAPLNAAPIVYGLKGKDHTQWRDKKVDPGVENRRATSAGNPSAFSASTCAEYRPHDQRASATWLGLGTD
jgi:hypothetical protein